jgi:hypothetical protein
VKFKTTGATSKSWANRVEQKLHNSVNIIFI